MLPVTKDAECFSDRVSVILAHGQHIPSPRSGKAGRERLRLLAALAKTILRASAEAGADAERSFSERGTALFLGLHLADGSGCRGCGTAAGAAFAARSIADRKR